MASYRHRSTVVVAAISLLVLFGFAAPVAAQSNDDDKANQFVELDVEVSGEFGWQTPSIEGTVVVAATRPVSGLLTVSNELSNGAVTEWEFPVDVAAGSEVEFPITLVRARDRIVADVQITSGNRIVAETDVELRPNDREIVQRAGLVGFDDVPDALEELHTEVEVSTLKLGAGLRGISGVSTVIADPIAVREMGPESLAFQSLVAWVRGGGQLVVDGKPGSLNDNLGGLPTANPNRFEIGVGSLLYSEDWREGIPVGGYVGGEGFQRLIRSQGLGRGSSVEIAQLSGLAFPKAGVIAGVLGAYCLLAGPVLFGIAASRRSRRMIWLGLPVLAAVTTIGVFAYGLISQQARSTTHITIAESGPTGSWAATDFLVGGGIGGSQVVTAPEGWSLIGQGLTDSPRNLRLRPTSSALEVATDLPPNGYALFQFEGASSLYDEMLTVTPVENEGEETIRAEVTNNSDVSLTDVVAFWGNSRMAIDDLAPGETSSFSIDRDDLDTRTMGELLVWPSVETQWVDRGFNGVEVAVPDPDATAAAGMWTDWRVRKGPNGFGPGAVGVVGWTDELPSPIDEATQGRTAIVARANIDEAIQSDTHFSSAIRLGSDSGFGPREARFGMANDHRFTLGVDTDPSKLALSFTGSVNVASIWTEDGWKYIKLPGFGAASVAVSPEFVVDGELLVRSQVQDWDAGATVFLIASDEADPAVLSDEPTARFDEERFDMMEEGVGAPDTEVAETIEISAEDFVDDVYTATGSVGSGRHDAFILELSPEASVVIGLNSGREGDAFLSAFDTDGNEIASNDDGGSGTDSQLVFETGENPQTLEIRASGLGGSPLGYTFVVEAQQ